jgi:hypothetical protein
LARQQGQQEGVRQGHHPQKRHAEFPTAAPGASEGQVQT